MSWVLPAARTNTSDCTGPVSGAVQVFSRTLVLKLPTFMARTVSTTVARWVPRPALVLDIVTRWPPGTATTDKTLFVTRACASLMLATVWYTQVSPTAMGNGIDPAGTTEFEVALGFAPALAVTARLGDPPA